MVVQHNLTAMNSNRMLGITTGQQAKSSEKLASGYQINRAADDAAGLSISEKMRKQMRGLDRASTNAQDGISAVQTAEGALTEVHAMLQRMNELAVQAANGTNSEDDRAAIQAEVQQLTTEIDRVAETTKFNETYLLKGNAEGNVMTMTVAAHDAGFAGKLTDNGDGTTTFKLDTLEVGDKITIEGKEYEIVDETDVARYSSATMAAGKAADGTTALAEGDKIIKADGTEVVIDGTNKTTETLAVGDTYVNGATGVRTEIVAEGYTPTNISDIETAIKAAAAGDVVKVGDTSITLGAQAGTTAEDAIALLKHGVKVEVGTTKYTAIGDDDGDDNTITTTEAYEKITAELKKASDIGTDVASSVANKGNGEFVITQGTVEVRETLSFSLHVGADADLTNKIGFTIDAMSAAGLGIKGINVADKTGFSATYAIDAIADAVAKVSAQRSSLGAIQNRLEHTIANLDNVVENTTAAESRIRDTDMASEMVEYSKNNILAQAGQSMLAQANQATQGVLSLLG